MNANNTACENQNPLLDKKDNTREDPTLFSVSEKFYKIRSMLHFLNYAYSNHADGYNAPITDEERIGGFFVFNSLMEEIKTLEKDCLFLIRNQ